MQLSDREKWILGVAGSIATLGIGYLIWRHENAITAAQNAQNSADEQAAIQQLQDSLGSNASSIGYAGAPSESYNPGAGVITPSGGSSADSELAAILAAFFPQGTSTSTGNGIGSTQSPSTTGQPSSPPATGGPVQIQRNPGPAPVGPEPIIYPVGGPTRFRLASAN